MGRAIDPAIRTLLLRTRAPPTRFASISVWGEHRGGMDDVGHIKDDLGCLAAGNILSTLVSHASGLQAQDGNPS